MLETDGFPLLTMVSGRDGGRHGGEVLPPPPVERQEPSGAQGGGRGQRASVLLRGRPSGYQGGDRTTDGLRHSLRPS